MKRVTQKMSHLLYFMSNIFCSQEMHYILVLFLPFLNDFYDDLQL